LSTGAWAILLALAAPSLQTINEAGYRDLLKGHRGSVLLVDFWATWCGPCREELPQLVALSAKLDRRRFQLVTVSSDEPEQATAAAKVLVANKTPEPFFIKNVEDDSRFINSVDPKWSGALPALFLYGRDGKLVRSFVGEVEMTEVEAAIRRLL
jgi:thiol-disulfide isomerase/thioredoxin